MNRLPANRSRVVNDTLDSNKQYIYINENLIVTREVSYNDVIYSISNDHCYVCAFEDTIKDLIVGLQKLIKSKPKKKKCKIVQLVPKY